MTRKDYETIAAAVKAANLSAQMNFRLDPARQDHAQDAIAATAEYLAYMLEQDNPKFNRGKFLTACDIYETTI